jgi:hypothetical protein
MGNFNHRKRNVLLLLTCKKGASAFGLVDYDALPSQPIFIVFYLSLLGLFFFSSCVIVTRSFQSYELPKGTLVKLFASYGHAVVMMMILIVCFLIPSILLLPLLLSISLLSVYTNRPMVWYAPSVFVFLSLFLIAHVVYSMDFGFPVTDTLIDLGFIVHPLQFEWLFISPFGLLLFLLALHQSLRFPHPFRRICM